MHYGLHEIDGPNGKLLGWAAGFFLSPSLAQTLKSSGLIFSSRRSSRRTNETNECRAEVRVKNLLVLFFDFALRKWRSCDRQGTRRQK
jgi:hypothetical protein